jgi:hypothetical protein
LLPGGFEALTHGAGRWGADQPEAYESVVLILEKVLLMAEAT